MPPADPRRWRLLAIVPVALLLHNLEEALTIGPALPRMQAKLSGLLGRAVALPSERQFHLDLVLITAFGFALLLAARWWRGAGWALVALQAVMAVNVLTHVAAAVFLGGYAPGLVTAVLVEAPASVILFRRLRRERRS